MYATHTTQAGTTKAILVSHPALGTQAGQDSCPLGVAYKPGAREDLSELWFHDEYEQISQGIALSSFSSSLIPQCTTPPPPPLLSLSGYL